jgi:hypothetical protein
MTDAFDRGDGVWHPAPFRRPQRERPFLIISGPSHPFHGTEYVVVGLTRTRREAAIELDPSARAVGSPGGDSFASPWYFFTIKHEDIKRPKGADGGNNTNCRERSHSHS